jgi:hypothetical protein
MAGVRIRSGLPAIALVVTSLVAAGCGDGGEQADKPDSVEAVADAYVAALDATLPPTDDDEERPVVYVWQFGEKPISLDDQVVVIDSLAELYDVRFVDEADAAVDPEVTLVPPRDHGLLVGVGPVTVDAPHTMRVEIYWNEDDIEAVVLTLVRRDEAWTVTAEEPVEPEVLGAVI